MWTKKFNSSDRKKFLHLIDYIIEAINSGKLAAGEALPTQRELSKNMGVSIGTITKAFKELEKMGYLSGEIGRGTYVRDITKDFSEFWYNEAKVPYKYNLGHYRTTELFNHSIQLSLLSSIREVSNGDDLYGHLHDLTNFGRTDQKLAFAEWLKPVGITSIDASEICILSADVFSMNVIINSLSKVGDCVLMEEIGDRIAKDQLLNSGREIVTVKMDGEGLDPSDLEDKIKTHQPSMLVTLATFHNPTGLTTSLKRKKDISTICSKYGLKIVEDGKIDLFHDGPIHPYFEIDPSVGIYTSGFYFHINSSLTTSAVIGNSQAIKKIQEYYSFTYWSGSQLLQQICTHLIQSGNADRIIAERKKLLKERNQLFDQVFGEGKKIGSDTDVLKWLKIPDNIKSSELTQVAYENGILIRNSDIFTINPQTMAPPYVRICNGSIHSLDSYETALNELKSLIEGYPGNVKIR